MRACCRPAAVQSCLPPPLLLAASQYFPHPRLTLSDVVFSLGFFTRALIFRKDAFIKENIRCLNEQAAEKIKHSNIFISKEIIENYNLTGLIRIYKAKEGY